MRRLAKPALVLITVLALSAGITVAAALTPRRVPPPQPAAAAPYPTSGSLADVVRSLQARLTAYPRDTRAWSELGLAYVESARVTADPTYYPKAAAALDRAAALDPDDDLMLAGRATLAAARHQFSAALALADRALRVNPDSPQARAIRSDALTELGRYTAARAEAVRADRIQPGPSTFARLSYAAELRGQLGRAAQLMRQALGAASTPSDMAFAAYHLGELERIQGHRAAAAAAYATALRADPENAPALAGRARLAVARGDLRAAERDYLVVVRRLPLPEYVVELGEFYQATGRAAQAQRQYRVAEAQAAIAEANGVGTDLETALFDADHGSAADALAAARDEWRRRQTVHTADAMAWALHAGGRDRAALGYARRATALGTRDARLLLHRGAIEAALRLPAARTHLRAALAADAGASLWRAGLAHRLLHDLSARGGTR